MQPLANGQRMVRTDNPDLIRQTITLGMNDSNHSPALLQAHGLGISYVSVPPLPPEQVLTQLDLTIQAGEKVAMIGRSGSGKTTFLHACAGLLPITEGSLQIAGQALHQLSEQQRTRFRRQHVGLVFQQFNLVPTLNVLENLQFILALNRLPVNTKRPMQLLRQLHIDDKAQRFPGELSGGEQQRVAVARALVHQPALVLADEPTGNLDIDNAKLVAELLVRSCDEAGSTLLLVTHSSELPQGLDRVLSMQRGRLLPVSP
ncbi:MAG: ABC transporter ATP-binding protein [Gammaproteobacteria bacterium]|nr:ABC transporter ATP-binding protein [Gammaproteobacteria bacterium]